MPQLTFGGWTFGMPLSDLLNQAMIMARIYNFDHLGTSAYLQNQRVAEMINWTVQMMLEANPALAKSSDVISMPNATTYGSNTVAIPATMYGQDVTDMVFTDSSQADWQLGSHCLFLDRAPWDMLPVEWLNGTYTQRNPIYWSWDEDSTNQIFAPYPNDTTCQITRTFRVMPTVVNPIPAGNMLISGTSLGNVVTVSGNTSATMASTSTLAANDYITINYSAGPQTFKISSVTNATTVVLTLAPATSATAAGYKATVIGEIPVRFKNVPAYKLAAFLCEDIDDARYQAMTANYGASLADMQKQITKQIAAWNANYSEQPAQNQLYSAARCFPYVNSGLGYGYR